MNVRRRSRGLTAITVALLAACGGDTRGDGGTSGGTSAGSSGGTGSGEAGSATGGESSGSESAGEAGSGTSGTTGGSSGTTGGTSATTGGEEGGIRFDIGGGDVPGGVSEGGTGMGCDKVDFLFVVDNSGSMEAEQQNLANSFPGFISAIQTNPQLQDFHVMVIDTDDWFVPGGDQGTTFTCPGAGCCSISCGSNPGATCNGMPCTPPPPDPCDEQLGAGKNSDPAWTLCGVENDRRYMLPTQPDLGQTFGCLARVGIKGDGFEQQAGSMLAALGPALNGAGGCNEGFLRDDAILVVTMITDEEDGPEVDGDNDVTPDSNSPGNAASWRQALIDLKHGDETAIVMLGVVGDTGTAAPICTPFSGVNGAENCQQLRDFSDSFTYGQWASVCAPDYAPFFAQAVSVIESACDVFVPPG